MTKSTDHPYGPMAGIENGRAKYAYTRIDKYVGKDPASELAKNYRSYIKKLPSIIKTNGLGEAMAFYYSQKKGSAYFQIYRDIAEWIEWQLPSIIDKYANESKDDEFIKLLVSMNSNDYRLVTIEVLALLNWMRRFVDGMVKAE